MSSDFLRIVLHSLLSCVLLLGNAPALWHYRDCQDVHCCVETSSDKSVSRAWIHRGSVDCCPAHTPAAAKVMGCAALGTHSSDAHHPEDCSACKLAIAGFLANLVTAEAVVACQIAEFVPLRAPTATDVADLSVVRLRGPPVQLV